MQSMLVLDVHLIIKNYKILDHSLSVEAGDLTPTLKLKRQNVAKKYKAQIAELYPI